MDSAVRQATGEELLRTTRSVCSRCLQNVPARLVVDSGAVYLRKSCPEHGEEECLLSHHPWYYAGLDRYFFRVMEGRALAQRDYLVRMTERCNLQCPICLAAATPAAGQAPPPTPDMELATIQEFLRRHSGRKLKIDLISAEPTLREDLPDIIRSLKRQGHIVALHTNGIRLADEDYCRTLKSAGMDEVHLQMDGFDDEAYMKIRGARLTRNKLRVMENLQKLGIATDLVMVIMPHTNEAEIPKVLEYCRDRPFVRELFFLGTRALGYFRGSENLLMPDQVIDMVEERTGGLCRRRSIFHFQKLYFALLSLLGVRKCLYVQHFMLIRRPGQGWLTLDELIDWGRVDRVLEDLPAARSRGLASMVAWWARLAGALVRPRLLPYLPDFLGMLLRLKTGWNLDLLPSRILLLGFITACDPLNLDEAVARYCGKGELANDVGLHESGAEANIDRERYWASGGRQGRAPGPATPGCT
jgi:molybdenum cofactor biosynthesis enzyme MoaA